MKISYKNLKRYKEIAHVLMKYGFSFLIEKLNIDGVAYKIPLTNPKEEIKHMSTGQRIRYAIEELGPTYIKLGQIMSTRKDLFDSDIIYELSKLRDSVSEFSTVTAKEILESELEAKIDEVFEKFNEKPLAAASIGQVYEARLKNGEEVIVKIQRPNIEKTIKSDLEILQNTIGSFKELNKEFNIDFKKILEEFQTQLLRELDYNFEAINATKFKNMFKEGKEVYIPHTYLEYTTKRVLVMEKIIGVKLSDIDYIKKMGWDIKKISDIGVDSLLKQIFEYGFFHADPHPGNIFVVGKNTISYVDFGMIGIIDREILNWLNQVILALIDKNVDKIIYLLMDIDILDLDADTSGIRQDILYMIHYYYDAPIDKMSMADILNEIFIFFKRYQIAMPVQLATLAKTIITLEGTGRTLNPDFSMSSIAPSFAKYYYLNEFSVKRILNLTKSTAETMFMDVKNLPKQMRLILRKLEKDKVKITVEDVKLPQLEARLVDIATQLSLSLVLAAMIVASALIVSSTNFDNSRWIKLMGAGGFIVSFITGILLLVKTIRSESKKK